MKKTLSAFTLLLLALSSNGTFAQTKAHSLYVINTHITNFRKEPTTNSKIIKRLPKGRVVMRRVTDLKDPKFIAVQTKEGEHGWIHARLLSPLHRD